MLEKKSAIELKLKKVIKIKRIIRKNEKNEKYALRISKNSDKAKLLELKPEIILKSKIPRGFKAVEMAANTDQRMKVKIAAKIKRNNPAS